MGLFQGMKDAKYGSGGNYATPGSFDYDIELIKLTVAKTVAGVDFFACDFKILGTNNPNASHGVGRTLNYYTSKDKLTFLGNVKAVMVALYGTLSGHPVSDESVGEAEVEALLEPVKDAAGKPVPGSARGTAAAGTKLKLSTRVKLTKKGTDFTVHNWFPA